MRESIFNQCVQIGKKLYIFNTNNAALIEMEDNLLESPDREALLEYGFIVEDGMDEVQLLEDEVNAAIEQEDRVLELTIELTNTCNFRCVYCYQDKKSINMSIETADQIIHKISQSADNIDELHIHYFGGEPLLNVEVMYHFDLALRSMSREFGFQYVSHITTNGALLTKEIFDRISFDYIQLTFDGFEKTHNKLRKGDLFRFKEEMELAEYILIATKSILVLRMNVCAENKDEVIDFYRYMFGMYGAERISPNMNRMIKFHERDPFTMLSSSEYAGIEMELKKLINEFTGRIDLPIPKSLPCKFVCNHAYAISPDGKCDFCSGCTGNGKEQFSNVDLKKKRRIAFRSECKQCKCLPLCLGGCDVHYDLHADSCIMEKYYLKEIISLYIQENVEMIA